MIVDLFLLVIQGILNIILSPLTVINIAIDFISSIPIIIEFLQVAVYLLPFSNLLPLIILLITLFSFRIIVALIKTCWDLIPFV